MKRHRKPELDGKERDEVQKLVAREALVREIDNVFVEMKDTLQDVRKSVDQLFAQEFSAK